MTYRRASSAVLAAEALQARSLVIVFAALLGLCLALLTAAPAAAAPISDEEVQRHSFNLIFGDTEERDAAVEALTARGKPDVAAALILALRYHRVESDRYAGVLRQLTGGEGRTWFDWMLWQQKHPEVKPHPSFGVFKLTTLLRIDRRFESFIGPYILEPEAQKIRLEEITWGGVQVDGIPPLDNPDRIPAAEADYLLDDDLVFGVEINGDARAYPLRILGWHEMFNEVIGGVPVALAYCTLCGSGILYETQVEGREEPLILSSSGLLYRSNKLMYDRQTESLWNQFTGRPVSGPLRDSGIELKVRPVAITSWAEWRRANPETTVLSLDTGHNRDYGSGVVYRDYFASPDLMFPALVDETELLQKDYVFGVRGLAESRAWPLSAFAEEMVINDAVGSRELVLLGDPVTRTVRAYERRGQTFAKGEGPDVLRGPEGGAWRVTEAALEGPGGERLPRVPGHIAYWFAWDGYWGTGSSLYPAPRG